jgi:tetratricopeptide (TPR) repeat protein
MPERLFRSRLLRQAGWLLLLLPAFLLLLEWRLRISSPLPTVEAAVQAGALRIVVMGDSITRGMDGGSGSYALELQHLLDRLPLKIPVQVINYGFSGEELLDAHRRLPRVLKEYRPHAVVTMLGFKEEASLGDPRIRSLRVYRLFLRAKAQFFPADPAATLDEDRYFRAVLATGLDSIEYHRVFGAGLRAQGRFDEALALHRQVVTKYPWHEMAHLEIAEVLAEIFSFDEAEEYYDKAIALSKKGNSWAQIAKAVALSKNGRTAEAEETLERSAGRHGPIALEFLADLQVKQRKFAAAADSLQKAVELDGSSPRLRIALAEALRSSGDEAGADRELLVAESLPAWAPSREGVRLYRAISRTLEASGILHIAVQYPLQPLEELRRHLGGEGRFLLYVDSEHNFRSELREKDYDSLFIDRFGGNFGHLTEEGNRLVASAILSRLQPWLAEQGVLP